MFFALLAPLFVWMVFLCCTHLRVAGAFLLQPAAGTCASPKAPVPAFPTHQLSAVQPALTSTRHSFCVEQSSRRQERPSQLLPWIFELSLGPDAVQALSSQACVIEGKGKREREGREDNFLLRPSYVEHVRKVSHRLEENTFFYVPKQTHT